jgi:hypothetical protein
MWVALIIGLLFINVLPRYAATADIDLVTILMILCFAKCIFDSVKARNRRVYRADMTESERSFETYVPPRQRRERRHHRRWSDETVQEEDWERENRPTVSQATLQSQRRRRQPSSMHAGYRQDSLQTGPAFRVPDGLECQICFDEKSREEFPSRRITKKCKHEPTDCCNACLAQAISTAFEGNMWDDIRCPLCNEQLQFHDMAELAPPHIFQRYGNALKFM